MRSGGSSDLSAVRIVAWLGSAARSLVQRCLAKGEGRRPPRIEIQFLERLALLGGPAQPHISALVLEPAFVVGSAGSRSAGVEGILRMYKGLPVVVVAKPNRQGLEAVHHIASMVSTHLFVLGVDDELRMSQLLISVANQGAGSMNALTRHWPSHVQRAFAAACSDPVEWSVKRLAAESLVSRRTLERMCAAAGLPPPGTILRARRAN
jgi:hypothetical protein